MKGEAEKADTYVAEEPSDGLGVNLHQPALIVPTCLLAVLAGITVAGFALFYPSLSGGGHGGPVLFNLSSGR